MPDTDNLKFRAELLIAIAELIAERGVDPRETGLLLNLEPADVSALMNGQITNFTTGKLIHAFCDFGLDVEFRVTPAEAEKGVLRVTRDVASRR